MLTSFLRKEKTKVIRLKRIRQLSYVIADQTLSGYMVKRLSAYGGCLGSQRR
jgi:hypothetical protein